MQRRAFEWGLFAVGLGTALFHVAWARHTWAGRERAVLITTGDVPAGEPITRAALDVRELPERFVDERQVALSELERVLGSRASRALVGGDSLLWSDLELAARPRSLAALVPVGMRAFALAEAELDFDGLLRAGDRVDVLFRGVGDGASSAIQVENALVLAVGHDLGDELEQADDQSGRVTVSVTSEQALRLATCAGRGVFRLALRHPHDLAREALPERDDALISHAARGVP